jgi:GDP-L-fucose synthase
MRSSSFLRGKRVLVTGGSGFLGRWICRELQRFEPQSVVAPRRAKFDLRSKEDVQAMLDLARPQVVIHAAALVGGIGANRDRPGQFFYDNAIMGLQLMEEARLRGVQKFVTIGTICAYPKHTPIPFREDDLWNGYPEETNAPYGLAKKMLIVQGQAYRAQYGFNAISLLPANLYGPGDNFDPQTSHVIPALIRKACEASDMEQSHLVAWGHGAASREFLFVRDAARGIVLAAEHYDQGEPVNLGTGCEITIRDLAGLICELCGFRREIRWDAAMPNGQPRRCLDVSRAEREFGFQAETSLLEGLHETIRWFQAQQPGVVRAAA